MDQSVNGYWLLGIQSTLVIKMRCFSEFKILGEINTQLIDANAKAIITLTDLYDLAKKSLKESQIPIITIKSMVSQ